MPESAGENLGTGSGCFALYRGGTTFRKPPNADKEELTKAKVIKLMLAQLSTIKRPVPEKGKTLLVGCKPEAYGALI